MKENESVIAVVSMARPRGETKPSKKQKKVVQGGERKRKNTKVYMPKPNHFFFPSPPSLIPDNRKHPEKTKQTKGKR